MNRKLITQNDRILRHLTDYKTITSFEAIYEYGITRLSAVIFNLRKEGYDIYSEREEVTNRYGEKTHFNKYILSK